MAHDSGQLLEGAMAITQIAVVVRDLQKTMELYHKTTGWGPWSVYEHTAPRLHDTVLRGVPTPLLDAVRRDARGAGRLRDHPAAGGAEYLSIRSGWRRTARASTTSPA